MSPPLPRIKLTKIQIEAMTGSLLGDGMLIQRTDKNKKSIGNCSFRIGRARKDKDYLQYEASIYHNILSPDYEHAIKCSSIFDKRPRFNKRYYKCQFATFSNITFTELHHKWYRQNENGEFIKIVPPDLILSPLTIAHWFADDGSIWLSTSSSTPRFETRFSTEGFTPDEARFLISLLEDRYNEHFSMYCRRNGQYIISGLDSASRALIADIDPHFHMQRKRIWEDPDTRYYINPPERQINREEYLKDKKQTFFEVLRTYILVDARDLARQLDYWWKSADGVRDDPDYHMLTKMIKPYIDSGQVKKITDHTRQNRVSFKINKRLKKVE